MTEQTVETAFKAFWDSLPPSSQTMPIGRAALRALTIEAFRDDTHRTLKELFNAGYRGRDLVL